MFECIARRILEQMELRGLSSNKLSIAAGLNRGFVRDIERGLDDPGRASIPKHDNIEKLARVLGCSVDYLLCKADHPQGFTPDPMAPTSAPAVDVKILQKRIQELETQLADAKEHASSPSEEDLADLVYKATLNISWSVEAHIRKGRKFSHDGIARATQEYFRACLRHHKRGLSGDELQTATEPALDSIMRLVVDNSR